MTNYKRSDMCAAIEDYVVNPRYRNVLRLRFCEGNTYEEIAEICNFSAQHVKHICKTYRDMLMSHL